MNSEKYASIVIQFWIRSGLGNVSRKRSATGSSTRYPNTMPPTKSRNDSGANLRTQRRSFL